MVTLLFFTTPSSDHVNDSFSGGTISRYSPVGTHFFSELLISTVYVPPTRKSLFTLAWPVSNPRNQRAILAGSVSAETTRSRVAGKVRLMISLNGSGFIRVSFSLRFRLPKTLRGRPAAGSRRRPVVGGPSAR